MIIIFPFLSFFWLILLLFKVNWTSPYSLCFKAELVHFTSCLKSHFEILRCNITTYQYCFFSLILVKWMFSFARDNLFLFYSSNSLILFTKSKHFLQDTFSITPSLGLICLQRWIRKWVSTAVRADDEDLPAFSIYMGKKTLDKVNKMQISSGKNGERESSVQCLFCCVKIKFNVWPFQKHH